MKEEEKSRLDMDTEGQIRKIFMCRIEKISIISIKVNDPPQHQSVSYMEQGILQLWKTQSKV